MTKSEICEKWLKYLSYRNPPLHRRLNANRAKTLKSWETVIDKLVRIDQFTLEEIHSMLGFIIQSDFWSHNFYSIEKFRRLEKNKEMRYSERIYAQAKQAGFIK